MEVVKTGGLKMKNVINLASEMVEALERAKRTDGTDYLKLKDGSPQWMTDVIHAGHFDGDRLPDDDIYERVQDCVSAISEMDDDSEEDDISERLQELEADCYTKDLTDWLGSNNYNVYYLTQALEEYEIKDGFKALSTAQYLYIQEIAGNVLSALKDEAEEE